MYQNKPYIPKITRRILTFDLEGYRDFRNDRMNAYLCGVWDNNLFYPIVEDRNIFKLLLHQENTYPIFSHDRCIKTFIDNFITHKYRGNIFYAHFGSIFDFPILLQELQERPDLNIYPITKGSKIIKLTIKDDNRDQWYFHDSSALLNFSLDELTKTFKVGHKKLEVVKKDSNYDKKLYELYKSNPKLVIEYLKHDCIGLYEILDEFKRKMLEIGGDLGLTIASTSLKTFKRGYQKNVLYMCGKDVNDEMRRGYYGGKTLIYRMYAPELKDKYYYYYDVNSLYPFVMSKYPYPVSKPNIIMSPPKNVYMENEGITEAIIKSPEKLYDPLLPSKIKIKTDTKLMFVLGKQTGIWDNAFLRKARELGYTIEPKKSYVFQTEYIFKDFVKHFYAIKEKSENGTPMYLIAKLIMNCFSSDTKIYTEDGIKNVRDVKKGDYVYSINQKSLKISLQKVEKTFKYMYHGKMVLINKKNCNFLVTPNHRFLLKQWYYNNYRFIEANKIMKHNSNFIFPPFSSISGKKRKTIKIGNNVFSFNDWLEFIGWYISEGHLKKTSINSYQINITQKKYYREIKNLLLKMGIRNSNRRDRKNNLTDELCFTIIKSNNCFIFRIHNKNIYNWLLLNCKKYSQYIQIPSFLYKYDSSHLGHLYKTLMLGDGSLTKKSRCSYQMQKYTTISKKLAYGFSRLCLHLGKKTRIIKEKDYPKKIRNNHAVYRIFIYSHKNTQIKPQDKSWQYYNGYVYCVSLKNNHTVLSGRGGKFEFIGQSLYGKLGQRQVSEFMIKDRDPDENEYEVIDFVDLDTGWIKVRQESKGKSFLPHIAIHVTTMAQLYLYETIENMLEKGYNIYYIDTDSITCDDNNFPVSKKLGGWKLEKRLSSGIFILPKTYKTINDKGKIEIRAKGYNKNLREKISSDAFEKSLHRNDYSGFDVVSDKKEMLRPLASFHRFKEFNHLDYIRRSIQNKYNKRRILKNFNTEPFDIKDLL